MNSRNTTHIAQEKGWLERPDFACLFEVLKAAGYTIIGPVAREGTIQYQRIDNVADLASHVADKQSPGRYQLLPDNSHRLFNWNNGPQGLKPWLFKPEQTLWTCSPDDPELRFTPASCEAEKLAVIGVRACDLSALALQDKHFMYGPHPDPFYQAQRKQLLLIAVNCSVSGNNCFCVSTGSGPAARFYYDLLLDELDKGFLVKAGSEKGLAVYQQLPLTKVDADKTAMAKSQLESARQQQSKKMPNEQQLLHLAELLSDSHWQQIEERCLACGNCTLVCPTCFCSKQQSINQLDASNGDIQSAQVRVWDSCFSLQHGYIFGKNFRPTIAARYRQWLIHKLVTWQQQYGNSGCVGCGRCITWCPAAIDLVEEVAKLLEQLPEGQSREVGL